MMKLKTFLIGLTLLCGCNAYGQMFFGEAKALPDSVFDSLAQIPQWDGTVGTSLAVM